MSWNAGLQYKVLPWTLSYFGVSKSHRSNSDSENTQNGIGTPESALQYEVGIEFLFLDDRYVLNIALFDVKRVTSPR
ncbi:TonB-dependent receptor [Paraburkholderia sp. SIMBA_054]